jgi:hypothetical protein
MTGDPEVLVDSSSATQSRGQWESEPYYHQAINRSHSDIVKFSSRYDEYYKLVVGRLEDLAEDAESTVRKRFQDTATSGKVEVHYLRGVNFNDIPDSLLVRVIPNTRLLPR